MILGHAGFAVISVRSVTLLPSQSFSHSVIQSFIHSSKSVTLARYLHDKTSVLEFARALSVMGVNILSTGGTAKLLADNGVKVTEVADYTGFPEMLDGRVKTLHPKVHGGILARRDFPEDVAALEQHAIPNIDMVVVNLYPFQKTVAQAECSLEDAIENIDIGGPAMLRSSAKNHKDVVVICDPTDYAGVLADLQASGDLPYEKRFA